MPGSRERTTRHEHFRFKNPGESYGIVRAVLGDGRFRVQIQIQVEAEGQGQEDSSVIVVARIRGNMRDRVIVGVGDVVLVEEECFIVKKYTPEEVHFISTSASPGRGGFLPRPTSAS